MRWEEERYVRLYTRDTIDWLALTFEAQGLLALLLRKAGRAGIIPLGKRGKAGIAALLCHPTRGETVLPALEELLTDGCVVIRDNQLVFPNFVDAQETTSTPAQRKRDQRERDRAGAVMPAAGHAVTAPVTDVTPDVTSGHTVTPAVTESREESPRAVPYRAVPYRTEKHMSAGADAPGPEVEAAAPEPDRRQPDSPGAPLRAKPPKAPPVDTGPLQEAWNAVAALAGLGLWVKTSTAREKLATRGLERRPIEGSDGWRAVFERIAASSFLRGGGSDGWRADIDWALRPDGKKTESAQLVLEGKYDDSHVRSTAGPTQLRVGEREAGPPCEVCGDGEAAGFGARTLCYRCHGEEARLGACRCGVCASAEREQRARDAGFVSGPELLAELRRMKADAEQAVGA